MNEYYGITTPTDDFIAHWGVKGMKWGVRKARPVSNGRPVSKSQAYQNAQKKIMRAASVGGTIGGVAGGLTKGLVGGAIGGAAGSIAGGLASLARNRKAIKEGAPTKADYNKMMAKRNKKQSTKNKTSKLSNKDKQFLSGMQKSANKHGVIGALTVGGGTIGGAIGAAKYIKQHPKEYAAYKKKYKQMSYKDRLKASYGRY